MCVCEWCTCVNEKKIRTSLMWNYIDKNYHLSLTPSTTEARKILGELKICFKTHVYLYS